ncbi:MAG: isochorismatase family protein [Planctomycetaceae bacterium]|nr:isochorismatase family protein [Planctomycetaceae bacterium]
MRIDGWSACVVSVVLLLSGRSPDLAAQETSSRRVYHNTLRPIADPRPLLADYPEFFLPIIEQAHYEAPAVVDDADGELQVRAWRFSYNVRGIVELPNRLKASQTAVIMVHPWGIDDGQGWRTPEPAGVADFCTREKNHLAGRHTRTVIRPFLDSLRGRVAFVMYSLPGSRDPIRRKLYRSFDESPSEEQRGRAAEELKKKLNSFDYHGEPVPAEFPVSADTPVIDYFRRFPGLDAGAKFNNEGFWDLPIPVCADVGAQPEDVVIYDAEGYEPLKKFLQQHGVRHILLTGYATDMCFCRTTAGYENLSKDFNVFLVGDASLATFPANTSPRFAVNAAISYAALNHLITQVSWVKLKGRE